ncbi:MAG TPA: type III PLP-dependent enzyme [Alphaproteobacteria bacterium]|nr:type III PLP-dependent enzyme [Alphaproteobacteria bacterium]
MDKVVRHASVEAMLRALRPAHPVLCLRPEVMQGRARLFRQLFPGRVLYAMKCNPHPHVLKALHQAGINDFDTASVREMAEVRALFPDPRCYFHHPVKSREAIARAYSEFGIRHFVVDHVNELDKLLDIVGGDVAVHVRLATPPTLAAFHLSAKFGAEPQSAADLLRRIAAVGLKTGLTFHVGSQCRSVDAFTVALELSGRVIDEADVPLRYLNVGGGFPIDYPGLGAPPLEAFLVAVRAALQRLALPTDCVLFCEPGRALVADGGSLVVQVQMRRDDRLYINDGIYGALMDLRLTEGLNPPVRLVRLDEATERTIERDFTIFGPTCDSIDLLPLPWRLPTDVREGDWIEVGLMGAYSTVFATDFNGLRSADVVEVADAPFRALAA